LAKAHISCRMLPFDPTRITGRDVSRAGIEARRAGTGGYPEEHNPIRTVPKMRFAYAMRMFSPVGSRCGRSGNGKRCDRRPLGPVDRSVLRGLPDCGILRVRADGLAQARPARRGHGARTIWRGPATVWRCTRAGARGSGAFASTSNGGSDSSGPREVKIVEYH